MAEDREQLLEHYRKSRTQLLEAIEGLTDEQMADPSLDGWSVADHLFHLAFWDDLRADEVERISAGYESACKMTPEQDEVANDQATALRRGLSPAQARWELETSRRRLLAAIAAATPRGLDPSLYGEAGLKSGHEGQHATWLRQWRDEKGI